MSHILRRVNHNLRIFAEKRSLISANSRHSARACRPVRHACRAHSRVEQRGPFGLQEGEVAHSEFATEGAVLEGGEKVIQFGECGAVCGFEGLDGLNARGEDLLKGERGEQNFE